MCGAGNGYRTGCNRAEIWTLFTRSRSLEDWWGSGSKAGKIVPILRTSGEVSSSFPGDRGSVRHVKVLVTLRAEAISIPHELFWGDPNMGSWHPVALTKPDRGVYDSFS